MKKVVVVLTCGMTLAVMVAGETGALAYPSWDGGSGNNCAACHGNFRAANYVSPSDGQDWGNLHNLHRLTMLGGDCNTCHGSPFVPVLLNSSNGGVGFEPIGCMGCHGRNEDMGNDFLSAGRGAGLRQHHTNSGITICGNCHSDANPANYTPVGESDLPPYYFTPDSAHPNKPTEPCSANGEEDYAGLLTGLDNDGNLLYDLDDPDCAPPAVCGNGVLESGEDCDDGNVQGGDCCAADCTFEAAGSACGDGNLCNGDESCDGAGACQSGTPLVCDDGNGCTDDACDPTTGCVNTNNTAACDDGDACTTADTCSGGICVGGAPLVCDDGNGCTDDACDPTTGCVNTNNTAACDDGDACTTADTCSGGVCVGGSPLNCDDGLFCNGTESCDPATGCFSSGDPCPQGTVCNEGADTCDPGQACGNGILEAGEACDDGNTQDGDCCSANCTFEAAGSACDDADLCNGAETCDGAGSCQPGSPLVCDDGNGCTDDACDPLAGCVHTNNTAVCDDGNACTTADACSGGVCVGGAPLVCDDGNGCTDDACDPATGCVNTNNMAACDDGDACTTADTCAGGSCVGGPPVDCDDGLFCNGVESCDSAIGCVSPGDPCGAGMICNEVGDTCDPSQVCGNGILEPGEACDDGNVLDGDCCSASCAFEAAGSACGDANLCNGAETCDGVGLCQSGAPLDCDDGNVCTDDTCDPTMGCMHADNTAACDDGNACTSGDTCSGGVCAGGPPIACDDGLFCNGAESCDPMLGCVSAGNPCPMDTVCNEIDDTCDAVGGGQAMYMQWCGFCHGDFQVDPPSAPKKVLGARPCSIEGAINGTDGYPGGVPAMQFLQGALTADQILAISDYLNSQTVTGMDRYITACSGCHGMDANGGIFNEGVRGEDAQEILDAIGHENEMQFLDCLPDPDIDMIATYLLSLDGNGGDGDGHDDDGHDGDGDDDDDDDDDDGHDGDDDDHGHGHDDGDGDGDGHGDDNDHVGGHGSRGAGEGRGK